MTKFIQGISPALGSVGSFSYDASCSQADLSSSLFSDHRGSTEYFLAQIPKSISRDNICIARFVAVPRTLHRQGWGRKLFRGLCNSLINERATLALLEVDPFILWPKSDELYANELRWRTAFYEAEGWTTLKNHTREDEVVRIFMYSNPIGYDFRDTGDLIFTAIDESAHRRHQSESDTEFLDD